MMSKYYSMIMIILINDNVRSAIRSRIDYVERNEPRCR